MKRVSTTDAPAAFGPFCQATVINNLVYTSGAMPLDPATGDLIDGDIAEQTHRTMRNLKAVIEAAGSSLDKTAQITVYLTNMDDFPIMNEIYASYFGDHFPARVAVGVASLAKGASVEMQAVSFV